MLDDYSMDTKRWTSAGLFVSIPGPIDISDMNLKSFNQSHNSYSSI